MADYLGRCHRRSVIALGQLRTLALARPIWGSHAELPTHCTVGIRHVVYIHIVVCRILQDGSDEAARHIHAAGGDPSGVRWREVHYDGPNRSLGSPVNVSGSCRKLDPRDSDHGADRLLVWIKLQASGAAAVGIGALRG